MLESVVSIKFDDDRSVIWAPVPGADADASDGGAFTLPLPLSPRRIWPARAMSCIKSIAPLHVRQRLLMALPMAWKLHRHPELRSNFATTMRFSSVPAATSKRSSWLADWSTTRMYALSTDLKLPLLTLSTMKMQPTMLGTWTKSTAIASSSPRSCPATRSPLCCRPNFPSQSASTAPRTSPDSDMNTAEMSMSTSSLLFGGSWPPIPTESRLMAAVCGRGTTAPLSISKLTR
mmetsp:Transcript_30491/g.87039  ORF Transcript_30491/g.87039 Transcript_30491/m.87039 type:complete len:233 (-) Transcript_30491:637-1335(-)